MATIFSLLQKYCKISFVLILPYREPVIINGQANGQTHEIIVEADTKFSLDEVTKGQNGKMTLLLAFISILVKRALEKEDFTQIGRLPKYFLPSEKSSIPEYLLEVWPGYETQTKLYSDGIFLNVDTATKFINKVTVLDEINALLDKRYTKKEIEDMYHPDHPDNKGRLVVMTAFNSRSYQIDGITFSKNPMTHTFNWQRINKGNPDPEKMKTNIYDYFKMKYNMTLEPKEQPLLFINKGND